MSDTASPAAPAPPGPDPAAKLRGVGGWLAWFALSCFVAPLVMVGGTLAAWGGLPGPQMDLATGLVPMFGFVRGFEVTGVFTLGAALMVLGVCIVQKRRFAALLAVVVLTVLLVFYAADVVLTRVATGQMGAVLARAGRSLPEREPGDAIQIARAILATLLWLGYFLRSKRVAATFGPAGWRQVAAWVGGRGVGTGGAGVGGAGAGAAATKAAPLVLALLAAPLARAAAQQAPPGYADAGHRFSVALPAGWATMPDSAFQAFRRRAGADSTLTAAFLLAGSGPQVGYPYAILQVQAGEPVEPESLAATLSGYHRDSGPPLGAAAPHGRFPAVYDRAADLVRWGGFETLPNGGSLRWYEGLRMTDFGFVALIMYGMGEDSLATAARLDSLAAGLAIEAWHRYRPGMAATAHPPHTAFLEAWGAAGFLALAAVVLGVLRVMGQRQAESV